MKQIKFQPTKYWWIADLLVALATVFLGTKWSPLVPYGISTTFWVVTAGMVLFFAIRMYGALQAIRHPYNEFEDGLMAVSATYEVQRFSIMTVLGFIPFCSVLSLFFLYLLVMLGEWGFLLPHDYLVNCAKLIIVLLAYLFSLALIWDEIKHRFLKTNEVQS